MDPQLIDIAQKAYKWAKHWAKGNNFSSLMGVCAVASAYTHNLLETEGIRGEIYYNHGHCFNVVDKGTLVDITAEQFGDIDLIPYNFIIGNLSDYQEMHPTYYLADSITDSVDGLMALQRKYKWPIQQRVLPDIFDDQKIKTTPSRYYRANTRTHSLSA